MRNIGDLMKQAQKMQKQMQQVQEQLADDRYEASAGGGMIKVIVDGKQKLIEIKISPEALKEKDITLIEDLILTAVGEAQRASDEQMQEKMSKLTGGFSLPF